MKSLQRSISFVPVFVLMWCAKAPCQRAMVVDSTYNWNYESNGVSNPVKNGMPVSAGMTFWRAAGSGQQNEGWLTLSVKDKLVTCDCKQNATLPSGFAGCSGRISLQFFEERAKQVKPSDLMAKLQSAFEGPEAREFFTANVRDVGSLEDAVIGDQGAGTDWKPAFHDLEKGEYEVEIRSLGPRGGPEGEPVKAKFRWDPATSAANGLPRLGLGVQRLRIQSTDGEIVGEVWILMTETGVYKAKATQFEVMKKEASEQTPELSTPGLEAFRRAALVELSRA